MNTTAVSSCGCCRRSISLTVGSCFPKLDKSAGWMFPQLSGELIHKTHRIGILHYRPGPQHQRTTNTHETCMTLAASLSLDVEMKKWKHAVSELLNSHQLKADTHLRSNMCEQLLNSNLRLLLMLKECLCESARPERTAVQPFNQKVKKLQSTCFEFLLKCTQCYFVTPPPCGKAEEVVGHRKKPFRRVF